MADEIRLVKYGESCFVRIGFVPFANSENGGDRREGIYKI